MVAPMDSYGTLDETRCSNYIMLSGLRLGLLWVGLGAAGFVLGKEISKKGLTTLSESVMVPTWLRTQTSTQTH